MNTGCALATLAPKRTMRSLSITSVYEQVVAPTPMARFSVVVDGVADACGVVDVVGAEEACDLLRDVVGLVGEPSRGQVEGEAFRTRAANAFGDEIERLVPGHATKPRLPLVPDHRVRESPEVTQFLAAQFPQRFDVGQSGRDRARPSC